LDDAGFRAKFAGSPIKRIGRDRFIRNVLYAIGNSNNPSYVPLVQPLLTDPDPVVAEAAGWALARITP
jgi:epoxyqueuosine reductase